MGLKLQSTKLSDAEKTRRYRDRLRRAPWRDRRATLEALGTAASEMAANGLLDEQLMSRMRRIAERQLLEERAKWTEDPLSDEDRDELAASLEEYFRSGRGSLL